MTRIAAKGDRSPIEKILLKGANFNSSESAENLTEILQLAPNFKACNISDQCGDLQKIKVEVRYATDEETGQVVITNLETGEIICSRETSKREENQKIEIY